MTGIDVRCRPTADGWSCTVRLRDRGEDVSQHEVQVRAADVERLDPGAPDPAELVRRSFTFLLEREPPSSILPSFDLMTIARYFPEYEATIRRP